MNCYDLTISFAATTAPMNLAIAFSSVWARLSLGMRGTVPSGDYAATRNGWR